MSGSVVVDKVVFVEGVVVEKVVFGERVAEAREL